MDLVKAVGKRVRELRKDKGYTQEELARQADLHRTYIGAIERGEKNATIKNLFKIADVLDVNAGEFFDIER